jgi:MFS family permease
MSGARTSSLPRVVAAASAGTAFEWYDFFVFGTLASTIAPKFTGGSESAAFLFTLGAFAAGFFVRPFGALFFGHIGDRIGRKRAFLQTILMMGVATTAIGLLPTYDSVGWLAPALLVITRLVQGFAMGGEYGGAAVYVAEHAESHNRGALTAWVQTTAALGLLLALAVVLLVRLALGETAFQAWGWRIPFLASSVLLALSLWIRVSLAESPEFTRMQTEMRLSRAPIAEAFQGANFRKMMIALLCILLAQGAVWYTGHFYAQFFLERVLKLQGALVNTLIIAAVVVSALAYLLFGWLSDRVGRKPVMIGGMALALVAYFPGFHALAGYANPALLVAAKAAPVVITADPATCGIQFDLLGRRSVVTPCDAARTVLTDAGVPYRMERGAAGSSLQVEIGGRPVSVSMLPDALDASGYPRRAEQSEVNVAGVLGVLLLFMLAGAALYGPQAAALVELFPSRVRYTALSVPYNIGTGWVGGLLPVSAFALVATTGDIFAGLWYPFVFTAISLVGALFLLPETRGVALTTPAELVRHA